MKIPRIDRLQVSALFSTKAACRQSTGADAALYLSIIFRSIELDDEFTPRTNIIPEDTIL